MRQQIKRGIAVMAVTGAVSAASSGNISVPSPILRRGRAFSESLLGIRFNMPRWQIAQTIALALVSVTLVAGATMHYHLPLMQKIADFHNKMPASPLPVDKSGRWKKSSGQKWEVLNEDLIKIEEQALEWHEKLWAFRTEIISSIALVNMDDEEEFELEALSDKSDTKWRWLTLHLVGHILLIILAHVYDSWLFTITAVYSQVLFLALFLRAKALGDAVSSSVSVVRKFARNVGSQVSVASSERTLLQFQVLQNKMDFLTDVHESHQLGMGFLVPFVGTLDIDLDTLLSISCGCFFELIILMATRAHTEVLRRRSEVRDEEEEKRRKALGIRTDESIMRDNVQDLKSQVDTLQKQVKGKLDQLEMLMITSNGRPSPGVATTLQSTLASPPNSGRGGEPTTPLERTFRNFLRCKSANGDDDGNARVSRPQSAECGANESPKSSLLSPDSQQCQDMLSVSALASFTPSGTTVGAGGEGQANAQKHTGVSGGAVLVGSGCPPSAGGSSAEVHGRGGDEVVGDAVVWHGLRELNTTHSSTTSRTITSRSVEASACAHAGVQKEQLHPQGGAGSGSSASAARAVGEDVEAEQVGSVSPGSKYRMSLNFSRLLGGSAVHVNSALPAGIAANIALAAGGFSASSFLPLSHGGGQREHASQKGPVSSENGCSASPRESLDGSRASQERTFQEKGADLFRSVFTTSAASSVSGASSLDGEGPWSWGGIRQRVRSKKTCASGAQGKALASAPARRGVLGVVTGVEDMAHASGDAGVGIAGRGVAGGGAGMGAIASSSGHSSSSSSLVASSPGHDCASLPNGSAPSYEGKVYGGGTMPPGFVFENGQLRETVSPHMEAKTGGNGANAAGRGYRHTRVESVDFQDCVEDDAGVLQTWASPHGNTSNLDDKAVTLSPMTCGSAADQEAAMGHHSLRWEEENNPSLPRVEGFEGCLLEGVVRRSRGMNQWCLGEEDSIEMMFEQIKNQHLAVLCHLDEEASLSAARPGGAAAVGSGEATRARAATTLLGPFGAMNRSVSSSSSGAMALSCHDRVNGGQGVRLGELGKTDSDQRIDTMFRTLNPKP